MGIVVIGAIFVDIKGYPLNSFIPAGRNAGRIEEVHGGVSRNVAEDIANVELRPTLVSLVDDTGTGTEVIEKLRRHKVNTEYIRRTPDGMGTWLAVFDSEGDVYASISKRPDLTPVLDILKEYGDEIFMQADAITMDFDMDRELVKTVLALAKKYGKSVYGVVSNMSIAVERRDLLQELDGFVCNLQEAGQLFLADYTEKSPEEMAQILAENIQRANMKRMVVTMGGRGAVYAESDGECGVCPAMKVNVVDTTGAGDSFFAGVAIGLTYGKSLSEACAIGSRLAAAVICTTESVCPRFLPSEFGLDVPVLD